MSNLVEMTPELEKAYKLALETRERAYAPYSKFKVGSTVKIKGQDKYYSGCNIENASFGATMCAERVAFFSALAENGKTDFDFCLVLTDTDPATPPCALCLQVICEFCPPEFTVYLANLEGIQEKLQLSDLLGRPFNSENFSV